MGAQFNFGVTLGPSTSTTSPLRDDDPYIIYCDDHEGFQDFTFNPFTIHQTNDDDNTLMTQGQFKQLSAKLDSILESFVTSSNYEFMLKSDRKMVEKFTHENAKVLAESTNEIQVSEKTIANTTEKLKNYMIQ